MKRVMIIGCPGAGKSTLARRLHEITGLPLYYLDMLWHRPDRTTVPKDEFDERLSEIVSLEQWIIDGNYGRTLEMRMAACDTVLLLDLPLEVCLSGAVSRIGRERADMPWIEESFDPEFRQWILDFPRDNLPRIYELIEKYRSEKQIRIFHTRDEAEEFLSELSRSAAI